MSRCRRHTRQTQADDTSASITGLLWMMKVEVMEGGEETCSVKCVAVQGEDIYWRVPNITDACQPA